MYCQNCGNILNPNSNFCGSCGTSLQANVLPTGGKITVVRPKKFVGCAIPFKVFIGETFIGTLTNNSSVSYDVPFGEYMVVLKSVEKNVMQPAVLNENQREIIIEVVPKVGLLAARPNIISVRYN